MSDQSENIKKERPKPQRDENGWWLPGSNGGHVGGKRTKWTEDELDNLAEDLIEWIDENVKNEKSKFLLGDWCFEVGMIPQDMTKFGERSAKFKHAHTYAKGWQEHMVAKGALFKKLEPNIAKFMLTCHHGWKENQKEEDKEEALNNDFKIFNTNMAKLNKPDEDEPA